MSRSSVRVRWVAHRKTRSLFLEGRVFHIDRTKKLQQGGQDGDQTPDKDSHRFFLFCLAPERAFFLRQGAFVGWIKGLFMLAKIQSQQLFFGGYPQGNNGMGNLKQDPGASKSEGADNQQG